MSIKMANKDLKKEFLEKSKKIGYGNPSIHVLKIEETYVNREDRIRKCQLGSPEHFVTEMVIMVVGATGAGKTTLINGLVNYIVGVDWEDNFRFKLIADEDESKKTSQSKSQTKWISSYTLHYRRGFEIDFTVTVIDTPGFGDTGGIKRDKEIVKQIRAFFTTHGDKGITHIDAIGFVTQASLPRLTVTQRYIIDSVLSLFGKDISENIFLLTTFADGKTPPVMEGIKEARVPYNKVLKFNNSALYADNGQRGQNQAGKYDSDEDEDHFDEMFWKMGKRSFATFVKSLRNTESKSLYLTKQVLDERQSLEASIIGIQHQIRTGLNKLERLRIEEDTLKKHEADIEKNKDFAYIVEEESVVTENIPKGTYITNCIHCNYTCHYPCKIPEDGNKKGCAAMNREAGVCKVCPSRCPWVDHKNMTYKFNIKTVKKTKTSKELKARFEAASGEKMTSQKLIKKVTEEFEYVQLQVIINADEVRKSLARLKEIALKPNPESTVEYIDVLIETEKAEGSPGWTDRVKHLRELRKQAEVLQDLSHPGDNQFKKYTKVFFEMLRQGNSVSDIHKAMCPLFKYLRT